MAFSGAAPTGEGPPFGSFPRPRMRFNLTNSVNTPTKESGVCCDAAPSPVHGLLLLKDQTKEQVVCAGYTKGAKLARPQVGLNLAPNLVQARNPTALEVRVR